MLNISLISSSFWHVKIVHFLCSNFQVFAGIFTRCPTCQRAHIYHFCSFCIRCHICHFPIAIWSQNLGIGTIFEPNLPLKTGCNKFQMESVKMKKATKTVAFRQLAIYCNIVDNQLLTNTKSYFPMQKFLNIFPSTSSFVISPPTISAKWNRHSRKSWLTKSPDKPIAMPSCTRWIASSA